MDFVDFLHWIFCIGFLCKTLRGFVLLVGAADSSPPVTSDHIEWKIKNGIALFGKPEDHFFLEIEP
jgi:hypothetical protein